MNLEIINSCDTSKGYYGKFTKKEKNIIKDNCIGNILNLFSGSSNIGNVRVDYSCKEANCNMNVFKFLEYNYESFNTVIIDFPYNQKFGNKYQKIGNTPKQFIGFANARLTTKLFKIINEKIKPDIIIMKSWNYYIPKEYKLKKGYLCYSGGYRKPTILLIMEILK